MNEEELEQLLGHSRMLHPFSIPYRSSRPNTLPNPGITGLLGDYLSTLDKINRLGNTGLLDTPSDDLIEKNVLGITTPGGGGGGYSGYETPGLSDWLNENVPPLKPAPEVPEYTPLDYEPTPYETEPWVSYFRLGIGTGLGEWDLSPISKYNMDYNDSQSGYIPYAPPGEIPAGLGHLNLPANPWPEYADAEGYAEEAMQPFSRGPDGITPVWSWEIKNEELRKQQEFAKRKHREEYNSMVAEMVETERLRQEEYAAERQRYTDMYNADSFFDNLDKNAPPSTSGGFNVFDMIPGTFESVIDMIDPVNTTPTVSPLGGALLDHFGIDQKYETPQGDIDALMGDVLAE